MEYGFGIFLPDAKIISGYLLLPEKTVKSMFVHYPLFTQNHSPFLYYKKGHILRLLVNCGLSLLPFQVIYCETQILTDQKLTSSTFPCCVFVCPSKSVTSPLFSTFRPYKPYIFGKLMTHPSPYTDPPSPPYGLLSLAQFTAV